MLQHPWVQGRNVTTAIIEIPTRVPKGPAFKSKLQAKFFNDIVNCDNEDDNNYRRKTGLRLNDPFQSFGFRQAGF
jgi:hypothetical protein